MFEDNWQIDIKGNAFANYKASSTMKPYREYGGCENIFSEKLFRVKWWVYSLLQFELGFEYKGFEMKKDAVAYFNNQRGSPDYFTVVLFRLRSFDSTDFIPIR